MPASTRRGRSASRGDRACVYVFGLVFVAVAVIVFLAVLVSNIAAPTTSDSTASDDGGSSSRATSSSSGALAGCPGVQWRASDGSDRGKRHWSGAAGTRNHRYVYPGTMVSDVYSDRGRPNARNVSLALCKQAARTPKHARYTSLVWPFGQFVDHVITLSRSTSDVPPIVINVTGDTQFDPYRRGRSIVMDASDYTTTASGHRHPLNDITHFVDGNTVYGSHAEREIALRAWRHGLLRRQHVASGHDTRDEYPPHNTGGLANVGGRRNASMYLTGDPRANEQIPLLSLHILFLREHNYQARRLYAEHPDWSDECLYQSARRIVVAEMQHIVYYEFLPALLGYRMPAARGYDPRVDVRIYAEFSAAAYRLHTLVNDEIDVYDARSGAPLRTVPLREAFMNPALLVDVGIDALLLGLVRGRAERRDTRLVDSLTQFLFANVGDGAVHDLCAMNVARGREVGLPTYTELRAQLGLDDGGRPVRAWEDLPFEHDVREQLRAVYGEQGFGNIDLFIGLNAERAEADRAAAAAGDGGGGGAASSVHLRQFGDVHDFVLRDQFVRLRDGDPRYYEYDASISADERRYIDASSMREILLRNTNIAGEHLPRNVFLQ